ncbi:DUF2207 domain-containing protein [Fodinibius salsisoli]|uniref:DUF2207 domain-containing protein n=1 Tax=Fodinibius salsisoli TaxID=2820877 RepID=A0ABT3PL68_9BACT|nr:DUF2207 domain-containing protein [Fodinibius salsisoli]MCW9706701.1 DUF2207 domain-containing protein [Fodinibius salsisoli]
MKHHLKGLLILVLAITFSLPQGGLAKSYEIPSIRVEVSIQSDGSIQITEYRTYEFEDSFSWADYRLPLEGYSSIGNIRVAEEHQPYTNSNSEKPGTFRVQRSDEEIRVQWFYNADDEQRTFSISYTLEGAIVIGPEWSEFFWNYISSNREKDTDSLDIQLQLPQSVGTDSIFSWTRGPQSKISLINSTEGYQLTAANLDEEESVKIRAIFPRSVFDQQLVSVTDPDYTLVSAREDEKEHQQALAEQQRKDARFAHYGRQLMIITSLLSIGFFLFFYRKFGKRHSANHISATETIMVPGRLEPAVAGWLLQGKTISSLHLMATLLDLARRKYFVIEEKEPEKGWFGSEEQQFEVKETDATPSDELTEWEANLKNFVKEQIAKGNQQIDQLFSRSSYQASKWFSDWKTQLNDYCEAQEWYDAQSYKGVYANIAVQVLLLIGSVIATIWAGAIGVVPILITLGLMAGSAGIIRRTPEGEATYKRWKAYKAGLKNAERYSIGSDLLDKHAIYSVAFGLSEKEIKTMISRNEDPSSAFIWFVIYPNSIHSSSNFARAFSSLTASGATSFPGSVSSGAVGATGASAGVAGGGAAGGAG